jgi:hypothetical protein
MVANYKHAIIRGRRFVSTLTARNWFTVWRHMTYSFNSFYFKLRRVLYAA